MLQGLGLSGLQTAMSPIRQICSHAGTEREVSDNLASEMSFAFNNAMAQTNTLPQKACQTSPLQRSLAAVHNKCAAAGHQNSTSTG
jgi:hypothetical protein